ncbi:MAG: glycosyltransferase [Actinomycetota bacterium]
MLTVVIPTYNRKDSLYRVLRAFYRQTIPLENYEIIVVDDGSADGTPETINQANNLFNGNIRYFFQKNKGPAAARNLGIKEAKHPLVLFINDDTIPAENLIEQHLFSHQKWPEEKVAVLGYATWAKGISVPIYARHYLVGEYKKLEGLKEVRSLDFITCNVSVKKSFLLDNGLFDEDFPYAAHEDRELGYRLGKKGLRIMYNADATVYHYHVFQDPKPFMGHNKHLGAALAIWESKIGDEKSILFEFGLRDYSSLSKITRELGRELFFNSKVLFLWLWIISRLKDKEFLKLNLFSHLIAQAQKEGYRHQKRLISDKAKKVGKNVS